MKTSLGLSLGFLLVCANSVLACSANYSLPVDLNNYYSSIEDQQGDSLKTALNTIIRGHTDFGYSCVWTILQTADEDPDNSSNVIGFYTRRSIPKVDRDYGLNTPDVWNREHIWAKSHGFSSSSLAAHNDSHHLRATDKSVNADRASKDFANGGSYHWECSGCQYTSTTWSPPDEVKGDTARMMFYMATRYEGDDGVPDLNLVDATGTSGAQFGDLCDMLQWHVDDPVSTAEQQRNDIIYSYQGNRNPFIDHPDYAIRIWGEQCGISLPVPDPADNIKEESIPFLPLWAMPVLAVLLAQSGIRLQRARRRI